MTAPQKRHAWAHAAGEWFAIAATGGIIGGAVGITILAVAAWLGVLQWIGEVAR